MFYRIKVELIKNLFPGGEAGDAALEAGGRGGAGDVGHALPLVDHQGLEPVLVPGKVFDPHQPANITKILKLYTEMEKTRNIEIISERDQVDQEFI